MVNKKCLRCKKNITKKLPALECSRCENVVHADPVCAKLSNKQLITLKNSPGIEWSCEECMKNLSHRSSFVIPEDEEDEEEITTGFSESTLPFDTRKLVQDISRELKKTFREEFSSIQSSLEFMSHQISNMELNIKKQDTKIQDLDRNNQDLLNRNKNLELRVSVLEGEIKTFEQKTLSNSLEVAGLPDIAAEDVSKISKIVASKLNMDVNDIQSAQRLPGSRNRPGPILMEMKTKSMQRLWVEAGKEKSLTVGVLLPDAPKEKTEDRVYIREALTKHLKTLLYEAKTQLGKSYKFIWYKNGKVCVRESSHSKIYYISSTQQITQLLKKVEG